MSQLVHLPIMQPPRPVAVQRERQPQATNPQTRQEREHLAQWIDRYVERVRPVTPLSNAELRTHAEAVMAELGWPEVYRDYVGVILNNRVWRDTLATVPYERRLLLLPKCLRVEDRCPAPFDDFGLLCKQCGLCTIQDLQNEAERLGYACLVAEGSALVMAMIQTGKIDAIVGVSCLSVLEKAFPYMESAAIPGVAIPLLQDDCRDTTLDVEWLWDVIHLTSDDRTYRIDLDGLRREVETWFAPDSLERLLGPAHTETDRIARAWLAKSGKRWRPFLAVCAYRAARENEGEIPVGLKRLAIAVECFHKASLVHDDIEDGDELRYGEPSLHAEHGVPVALNVGDLLLGEGYRLIAECGAPAEAIVRMLAVAAAGHRTLCQGQGAELCWTRKPEPLSSPQVLDIFRRKTAPAFEVALQLGAAYADLPDDVADTISRYSDALGIAYQIRDDLEDLQVAGSLNDLAALRPSLPLAIAHEKAKPADKPLLAAAWRRQTAAVDQAELTRLVASQEIQDRLRGLLESYKQEAIRALADLDSASLKGLLRRVVAKIFTVEVKGWCSEFEARNAASRATGADTVGGLDRAGAELSAQPTAP